MAVGLVGTAGAISLGAANTAVTPSWGSGENRVAGNLLVEWVNVHGTATLPSAPNGWSIAKQQAGTLCSASIFYKQAVGGDAAGQIAAMGHAPLNSATRAWTYVLAPIAAICPAASPPTACL
jgi:hypothetical protein